MLSPLADESLETRGFKVSPAGSVGSQHAVHRTALAQSSALFKTGYIDKYSVSGFKFIESTIKKKNVQVDFA